MKETVIMEALKALIQEAAENDPINEMKAAAGALAMINAAQNAGLEEMLTDLFLELGIDPEEVEEL